jgi:hypothetical protein
VLIATIECIYEASESSLMFLDGDAVKLGQWSLTFRRSPLPRSPWYSLRLYVCVEMSATTYASTRRYGAVKVK